jgi:hypothetical protein
MMGARGPRPTLLVFRALVALGLVFCPLLQFSAASPAVIPVRTTAPASGPTGQPEEEKSEEHKSGTECATPSRGDRRSGGPSGEQSTVSPSRISDCRSGALPRAAAADPFRNGLGCPFRC